MKNIVYIKSFNKKKEGYHLVVFLTQNDGVIKF